MQGDKLYINGCALSWGSLVAKVAGDRLHGFTSFGYGHSRIYTKGYGMGLDQAPDRRSRGKYEVEPLKVKGYKTSMQALRQKLADTAGTSSYGEVEFQFLLQAVERDESPITIELNGCKWSKVVVTHEEGPDLLIEEVEFDVMQIKENGLTLFDAPEIV